MAKKLRWGILGTGMIAAILAQAIGESETGELTAVGSRSRASAEAFGQKFGIKNRFESYDEVIDAADVDAVYISLPNNLHAAWALRCAEARKHILCEKPLAVNAGEARAMIEAARANRVLLMEAFMYRVHPQTAKLAELTRGGAIGDIRLIEAAFCYDWPGMPNDNIRALRSAAGGAIMDVGCYCMSMVRLLAGAALGRPFAEPVLVKGAARIGDTGVDEWSTATLEFDAALLANLSCATRLAVKRGLDVWGSAGSLHVEHPWKPGNTPESATIEVRAGGTIEKIAAPSRLPLYANQVDVFAGHVADRDVPMMRLDDSLGQAAAMDRWRRDVGVVFPADTGNAMASR